LVNRFWEVNQAMANIQSQEISYSSGGTEMNGYIAWDADIGWERPGVLVVHEWWGNNEYARRRANMLAELGYTGMAVDLYGGGKIADNPDEAGGLMNDLLSDLGVVRSRFNAALDQLQEHHSTDAEKMAAIGYCMGGGIVLHMARYGADLKAVASFHGALPLAIAAEGEGGEVNARLAVYHGEDDVFFSPEEVAAFHAEVFQIPSPPRMEKSTAFRCATMNWPTRPLGPICNWCCSPRLPEGISAVVAW
jgi:dienelactone hydrolase